MEGIGQWAAGICFAAAAGGLCQMLAPDSGLGRVLKMSISVFFLCSILMPLRSLEFSFSDWESSRSQQHAEEISGEILEDSSQTAFALAEEQIAAEVKNFLSEKGIIPVQINIRLFQQEDSLQVELELLLDEKDRSMEEWIRQNLSTESLKLSIRYREGERHDG